MKQSKTVTSGTTHDTVPNVLADLLSEEALAAQIGVTIRTLQRWRQLRQGPPWLSIGRSVFYRAAATREWILQRERGEPQIHRRKRGRQVVNASSQR